MDFHFLGFTNRVLLMAKQTYVSDFSGVTLGSDAYNAQICVNDTIRDLSLLFKIKSRIVPFTITTVANQRLYALPKHIEYPIYSLRQQTSDVKMKQINTQEYDYLIPDPDEYGDPEFYYFDSYSPLIQDLSTDDAVNIAYNGTSVDGITITVQGYDALNCYVTEEIIAPTTVAGTSYGSQQFSIITAITKIDKTDDAIIVTEQTSGTVIAYLSENESTSIYSRIGLHPIPSSVMTLQGRGYIKINSLVNEYDVPSGLTEDFTDAIIMGAYARYLRYDSTRNIETVNNAFIAYEKELLKLRMKQNRDKDLFVRMRLPDEIRQNITRVRPVDRDYF